MGDLFRDGAKMLAQTASANLAQSVVYSRGAESVTVQATIGQSSGVVTKEYGVRERWESRDFLILASLLVINGEPIEPRRGDRITETVLDDTDIPVHQLIHEVLPPSEQEPCWRWSDAHRLRVRVHTKLHSKVPLS